jgi:hypothetical protein
MNTIALVDTRPELLGETIGTVISTHGTIAAAFKANEAFQSRMRASGVKSHIRTKIVALKVQLGDGEQVRAVHLFLEGEKSGQGSVMKWSDAYGKARNRQRTVGYTRPRMSWKKKPNHNQEFTCLAERWIGFEAD